MRHIRSRPPFLAILIPLVLTANFSLAGIITSTGTSCSGNCAGVTYNPFASGSASGLGTTMLTGNVAAVVYAHGSGPPTPPYEPWWVTSGMSITIDAATNGPVRPGEIDIQYWADGDGSSGGGEGGNVVGVFAWGPCRFLGCSGHTRLPFTLGVPFEIQLFAQATADYWGGGWSGGAQFNIQVLETIQTCYGQFGCSQVIYPVTMIDSALWSPEPRGLAAAGLLALAAYGLLSRWRARTA